MPSALLRIAGASASCPDAGRQQRLDDALAVAARERLERELGRIGLVHPRRAVAGAIAQEGEDGRPCRGLEQRGEALLGRAVDPLEILAHEDDRPLPAAPETHLTERVHRAGLDGLGAQHAQALAPLLHPEQVVEVCRPLLRVHAELRDARAHLPGDRRRAVTLPDVEAPPEDRDDGQVGDGAPVRQAVALEPGDALAAEAPPELEEQPGLPDSGLAHDAHDLSAPVGRGREAVVQELELPAAAGQRGQSAARPEAGALDPVQPVHGAVGGGWRRERHQRESTVEERRGRLRDDGPVRLGPQDETFQRLPGATLAVQLEPDVPAGVPHQELRDVDTQPDRDPRRLGPSLPLDRLADRDRRVRGPPRRVLDGLEAEGGHDAARAEVFHPAAEASRLLDEGFDQTARVQAAVVGRRAVDHRAEQCHAAGLPADGRRRRVRDHRRPRRRRGRRLGRALRPRAGSGSARPEPVLGDAIAQRVARDPEPPGGARHVPERLVERLEELRPLDCAQRGVEGAARGGRVDPLLAEGGRGGDVQHRRRHHRGVDEEGHPLHRVGELPDVPRPRMLDERRARVRREALGCQTIFGAGRAQEVLREQDHVRAPLAERRQPQRHDGEPVIEILAEAPGVHRGRQILVARGDDPDVDGLGAGGAEPAHGAVLQDLQELGLEAVGQERHLVEEERAAVGRLEQPGLRLARVRECPALEAEQLGLEQGLGEGGAVDGDERLLRAGPLLVEHACEQTLAHPGLPLDEQRRQPPPIGGVLEQPSGTLPERDDAGRVAEERGKRAHRCRHLTPVRSAGAPPRHSTLPHPNWGFPHRAHPDRRPHSHRNLLFFRRSSLVASPLPSLLGASKEPRK